MKQETEQVTLTETEEVIISMMRQNTGTHFLDSGGAYGRSWERNRVRDIRKDNVVKIDVYGDKDITISKSIFHYLTEHLVITKDSKRYQKMFDDFEQGHISNKLKNNEDFIEQYAKMKGYVTEAEHGDKCWLTLMEEFVECMGREVYTKNTYNFENLLDQTLQYTIFTALDTDEQFIMLQIHGGCDVRGGYTKPHIFQFNEGDSDYFIIGMRDISAGCFQCKKRWYSDDAGYDWYSDEQPEITPQLTLMSSLGDKKDRVIVPVKPFLDAIEIKEDVTDKVFCGKCGCEITFY